MAGTDDRQNNQRRAQPEPASVARLFAVGRSGIFHKPGATSAYRIIEGEIALLMVDGKVTGAVASGRGIYTLATIGASLLVGKTFTYSTQPAGLGQFALNVKLE